MISIQPWSSKLQAATDLATYPVTDRVLAM